MNRNKKFLSLRKNTLHTLELEAKFIWKHLKHKGKIKRQNKLYKKVITSQIMIVKIRRHLRLEIKDESEIYSMSSDREREGESLKNKSIVVACPCHCPHNNGLLSCSGKTDDCKQQLYRCSKNEIWQKQNILQQKIKLFCTPKKSWADFVLLL
jgi:hypothetical protein